ncbi:MAG: glycosyltransferase family 39 protein [Candidatus Pacebacteria bacterium]|nr:glycosyltransferase family 39 protein [Candidatus Paceibacterota bacterium]MDD4201157.1 glycosyltransferase family 39 protein [Candidatus Paceibacterota bacterium]
MKNKTTYIIATILLIFLFFISFSSILEDTLTFDETAHVTAGYSYLIKKDMRVNPEHPPLVKNIAAFPLLFLNLNFPSDSPNWTQEQPPRWWVQFDLANDFIYNSKNNPDKIMLFSRTVMILFLLLLGFLIFHFARKKYGNKAGLISLFLFSFSPTFLAHGRLINTDIGAAFGALLSFYFWLRFFEKPSKKNVLLAGITFGIALSLKFSLVLLIPTFVIITLVYALLQEKPFYQLLKYSLLSFLAGVIGMVFVVFPLYQYHVYNYPPERQARDAEYILETFGNRTIVNGIIYSSEKPFLRPFAQYFLGLFTAMQRVDGGNTTFFLGEISSGSFKSYFPTVYFIKETLTFHILTIISLALLFLYILKYRLFQRPIYALREYFAEFSMFVFMAIYWYTSINSNLNIGVRHLLPVFPFAFILVGGAISKINFSKSFKILLFALFSFQIYSVISIYPHFLAYFNETVTPQKGHLYVVDSNLDWGQDLKRLKNLLDEKEIDFIYIDYFGGGNLDYYLGEENYKRWEGLNSPHDFPKGNWLAVSLNQLQGGRGIPVKGYDQRTDYYMWLNKYEPSYVIGYSIFLYYVD